LGSKGKEQGEEKQTTRLEGGKKVCILSCLILYLFFSYFNILAFMCLMFMCLNVFTVYMLLYVMRAIDMLLIINILTYLLT